MALQGFALFALSALALASLLFYAYKSNEPENHHYGSGYGRTANDPETYSTSNYDSWNQPTNSRRRKMRRQFKQTKTACTICLQEINDRTTILPCDHQFHHACIDDWRSKGPIGTQNTCPNCRKKYSISGMVTIDISPTSVLHQ